MPIWFNLDVHVTEVFSSLESITPPTVNDTTTTFSLYESDNLSLWVQPTFHGLFMKGKNGMVGHFVKPWTLSAKILRAGLKSFSSKELV